MKTHEEYLIEKQEYSYKLYKKHKIFKKVRAVIIDENNKVVLLKHKDGGVVVPGGGVDAGETLREAVVREALEETGYKVKPIKLLSKNFYISNMEFKDITFPSKRVEYFYLCEIEKFVTNHLGLEGEFVNGIRVVHTGISQLRHTRVNKKGIQKLKNYIADKNECKEEDDDE